MKNTDNNSDRIATLLEEGLHASIPIDILDEDEAYEDIDIPLHLRDERTNPSQTVTLDQLIVHRLLVKAARGQDNAIREVFDRHLGKPAQYIHQTQEAVTYHGFLDQISKEEQAHLPPNVKDAIRGNAKVKQIQSTSKNVTALPTDPVGEAVNIDMVKEVDNFLLNL